MARHLRRQLTAWLGLLAMCLIAFAPTASHFVRAARTFVLPVCTVDGQGEHTVSLFAVDARSDGAAATAMNGMKDMPGMRHGAAGGGSGGHADHRSGPMDDCGYCDLFNHAPAIFMVPPAPLAPLLLLFGTLVLPVLTRYTPFGAFPSGRPRAPPAIS